MEVAHLDRHARYSIAISLRRIDLIELRDLDVRVEPARHSLNTDAVKVHPPLASTTMVMGPWVTKRLLTNCCGTFNTIIILYEKLLLHLIKWC